MSKIIFFTAIFYSLAFGFYSQPLQIQDNNTQGGYDIFTQIDKMTSVRSVDCKDKLKLVVFYENQYEKIFMFEGDIFKVLKGDDRREAILYILDRTKNQFIKVNYFNSY